MVGRIARFATQNISFSRRDFFYQLSLPAISFHVFNSSWIAMNRFCLHATSWIGWIILEKVLDLKSVCHHVSFLWRDDVVRIFSNCPLPVTFLPCLKWPSKFASFLPPCSDCQPPNTQKGQKIRPPKEFLFWQRLIFLSWPSNVKIALNAKAVFWQSTLYINT